MQSYLIVFHSTIDNWMSFTLQYLQNDGRIQMNLNCQGLKQIASSLAWGAPQVFIPPARTLAVWPLVHRPLLVLEH